MPHNPPIYIISEWIEFLLYKTFIISLHPIVMYYPDKAYLLIFYQENSSTARYIVYICDVFWPEVKEKILTDPQTTFFIVYIL